MNGISIQNHHLVYTEMMSNGEQPSKSLEWSSIASIGKVKPLIEKLSIAHREHILIDMRRVGNRKKKKSPNP